MRQRLGTAVCLCCLAIPTVVWGQTDVAPASMFEAPRADSFWAPFTEVPGDFSRFLSADNISILAPAAIGALAIHRWDNDGIEMALARLRPASRFKPGNIGGGLVAQTGGAFVVYTIGRLTNSERLSSVGGDLVRAQILTQGTVQAAKFVSRRTRPDASDNYSLPSGHAAGTFATATVLQRHFGWKVGVPAYAAGVYVAASRMAANKHHLSDVIMGATFGIVAGRSVTVGTSKHRFAVGVSPTAGGGAVTFTKK